MYGKLYCYNQHDHTLFEDRSDLFYDIRRNVSGEKYVVVLKFERHCSEHDGYCSDPVDITSTTTTCYMYLTVDNLVVKAMDSKDKDYKIEFDDQDVGFSCGGSGYCGCTTMYNNLVGKVYNVEDPNNIKKYYGGGHFLEYYNSRVGERDARIAREKYEKENAVRIRQEKYDALLKKVTEEGGKVYSCYGNGGLCKDWIYLTVEMDRKLEGRRKYCEKCLAKYKESVEHFKESMYKKSNGRTVICSGYTCNSPVFVSIALDERLGRGTGRFCRKCLASIRSAKMNTRMYGFR